LLLFFKKEALSYFTFFSAGDPMPTAAISQSSVRILVASPQARQLTIVVFALASLAITATYAHVHSGTVTDPALTRLLRAMAAIKVLLAGLAGAAVLWRLVVPAGLPWLAAYAAAAAATVAGPVLIWNLSHIAAGALLLHGGLLATILLLWRDPGTAERLEHATAIRLTALRG
jgi:hypothetical protein